MPPFLRGKAALMKFLRVFAWFLRVFLFLMLFLFALKNTDLVRIRFLFDVFWETPLSFLLLITLVIGASLGLIAVTPRFFAQRREIANLKREIAKRDSLPVPASPPDFSG